MHSPQSLTRRETLTQRREYYRNLPQSDLLQKAADLIESYLDAEKKITVISSETRDQLIELAKNSDDKLIDIEDFLFDSLRKNTLPLDMVKSHLEQNRIFGDEDDIRQAVHLINQNRHPKPTILNVPNFFPPHNPLFTKLQHDAPLPPEVVELLDYFTF